MAVIRPLAVKINDNHIILKTYWTPDPQTISSCWLAYLL